MTDIELVSVFDSTNPGLIALAKSILEGAGIDFIVVGESAGAVFAGNPFFGHVRLDVVKELAEEATALLAELANERPSSS